MWSPFRKTYIPNKEPTQNELNARLLEAAENGDVPAIKQTLADGANVNTQENTLNDSPLHLAACCGHLEAVYVLLEAGANVDILNDHGESPLHDATDEWHATIMKVLLEAGATIDLQCTHTKNSPLHLAASGNGKNITALLLAAGADLTLQDCDNDTAVNNACNQDHFELAHYLQSIIDDPTKRPTPEEVGLNMEKRIAALQKLGKPLGKFTEAEAKRIAQRKTREAQRQEALDNPSGGI